MIGTLIGLVLVLVVIGAIYWGIQQLLPLGLYALLATSFDRIEYCGFERG